MNFTDLRVIKTQEHLQNALLELLNTKELKEITVKEICNTAGISRNAFYQHYSYKEDLYNRMVEQATERIRDSLAPIIPRTTDPRRKDIESYARHIIEGISEVKDLIYVMLKGDDGRFLRQLTDLISGQNIANALPFFEMKDSRELRLYYEFQSAGLAAFIIKWVLEKGLSETEAAALLAEILLQAPGQMPGQIK